MEILAAWIAAFLTVAILSFLYKDNPVFRIAESVFAGVSLGYYVGTVVNNTLKPNLVLPLVNDFAGSWHLVFAGAFGLLLYARYVPRIAWLGRWALAVYVGYYVGINMIQKLQGEVLPQAQNTMVPLNSLSAETLNNLVIAVGVLSVLVYFFFSREHHGPMKGIARLGIYFLMVSFGAAFGYTVMGRVSLIIGRMSFLLNDWAIATWRAVAG